MSSEVQPAKALGAYIRGVVPTLFGLARDDDVSSFSAALDGNLGVLEAFASDAQSRVLCVRMLVGGGALRDGVAEAKGEDSVDGETGSMVSTTFTFSTEVDGAGPGVALIKRQPAALDEELHVASQLQVLSLGAEAAAPVTDTGASDEKSEDAGARATDAGQSLVSMLHGYVRHSFMPLVASLASASAAQGSASGGTSAKRDKGVLTVVNKVKELELALNQCQKNVEVPEVDVLMHIHPALRAAAETLRAKGVSVGSADLADPELRLEQRSDDAFLNTLQRGVGRWIKEIQRVTCHAQLPGAADGDDACGGSAEQEAQFWVGMERGLKLIEGQLQREEVTLTLKVLKEGRRLIITNQFEADNGMGKTLKLVTDAMKLMRDFPINKLLAAHSIEQLEDAVKAIFKRLSGREVKLAVDAYKLPRVLRLIEAVSRDLATQVAAVLAQAAGAQGGSTQRGSTQLMRLLFPDFDGATRRLVCEGGLFATWDAQLSACQSTLLELASKRNERTDFNINFGKLELQHERLRSRIEALCTFRREHDQLQRELERVLNADSSSIGGKKTAVGAADDSDNVSGSTMLLQELKEAYNQFLSIDVLDVSDAGEDTWIGTKNAYDLSIERVETRITSRLTDRLAATVNADEMFSVFAKYNALFFRPRIRGAMKQFQMRLIETVKQDVAKLQDKFTRRYDHSEAKHMSSVRDLPPISGAIIWARQIDRQLQTYMQRLHMLLGEGWEQHTEGRKLKEDGDAFRRKLDAPRKRLFEHWKKRVEADDSEMTGPLFEVQQPTKGHLQLAVAFDADVITLFKEVRNLEWLMRVDGLKVPSSVKTKAGDVKDKYPYAMSLQAALRTYDSACRKEAQNPSIALLAVSFKNAVHEHVQRAFVRQRFINWDSIYTQAKDEEDRIEKYVQLFALRAHTYHDKIDDLVVRDSAVRDSLKELAVCEYSTAGLGAPLGAMQKLVDAMNLAEFSNLGSWVADINLRVEKVLGQRLQTALTDWVEAFKNQATNSDRDGVAAGDAPEPTVHRILLRNQVMYLHPPLAQARCEWVAQLHRCINTVCGLRQLDAARYEGGFGLGEELAGEGGTTGSGTFGHVLRQVKAEVISSAFAAIEEQLGGIARYVKSWLQYQSLWDMQISAVTDALGEDVPRWLQLLQEIKRERSTFDTSDSSARFGPITIDYSSVQTKVNNKYDAWHRDILQRFGQLLAELTASTLTTIASSRAKLEQLSLDSPDTDTVVDAITLVQSLSRQVAQWQQKVDGLVSGEKLLKRQRIFTFPTDWVEATQVQGEWDSLQQLLHRRRETMDSGMDALQSHIMSESRAVDERAKALLSNWAANKPLQGTVAPADALESLRLFEASIGRATEQQERIVKAKDALRLPPSAGVISLDAMQQELAGLLEVWQAMSGVHAQIEEMKETPWNAVVVKKLRKGITTLQADMKAMNNRIRQYEAFKHIQATVQGFSQTLPLIQDLRSDALKERHWKDLLSSRVLAVAIPLSDITLGTLWNGDLQRHEAAVKDIIRTAQGEMALEEFLNQVRQQWTEYELELVNFQNRCRLIRGWGDIFDKLDDNLGSLATMSHSPFYHVFAETATTWTDRLTALRVILDTWIDVQRKWVYLQGIFFGSADIKQQLPKEFGRFKTIDNDFVALMRKVSYKPAILEVAAMPNLQRQLERQDDLLNKIQKALGEYLEHQRRAFSRFYFVGDEDLLDIIGNGGDPRKIQRHLSKMFAGIVSFEPPAGVAGEEAAERTLGSMVSREGEVVPLASNITVAKDARANDWLTRAEQQMHQTLASQLEQATQSLAALGGGGGMDNAAYFSWLEPLPTQIATLSTLVGWSNEVEAGLKAGIEALKSGALKQTETVLRLLSERVLTDLKPDQRKKCEQLITVVVHKRDVTRQLIEHAVSNLEDFRWLYYMRFYYSPSEPELMHRLNIKMASASFFYGFEYTGVGERLVQTPLTDRCYLTLTQALQMRMGGNPFGPAGTGKTESVKALGAELGRFVLVFNCDENFDFQAMGRLFVGLCQVGAWGCFDEFNRLEERILSAVSQQILTIQQGLAAQSPQIELIGKSTRLDPHVGIFVTMNLGYAGRSILPDNLKQLFRPIAMTRPDQKLIAQVMLFSQGVVGAESLSGKIVLLFNLCHDQLSSQPHYDFGLRALKSVLVSAGHLKRLAMDKLECNEKIDDQQLEQIERDVLIQSTCDTVVPKLVDADVSVFGTLLAGVFPGVTLQKIQAQQLRKHILELCSKRGLIAADEWLEKVLQIYQVQQHRHGLMMVGPSGTGKTTAWSILLEAMEMLDGVKGDSYVIDPKAINKDSLFGTLDPTTAEWTDGIFTHTLRQIINNVRGEADRRHWIVLDGDVDPEWAENLNSVLDDNRLLTLPSGERLQVPSNVRIMMETETLRFATLATVSRCGMIWFNDSLLSSNVLLRHELQLLRTLPQGVGTEGSESVTQRVSRFVDIIEPFFTDDGLVDNALSTSLSEGHVMPPSRGRLLLSLFSMLGKGVAAVVEYDENHPDFAMEDEHLEKFALRWLCFSLLWGFGGSMSLQKRQNFGAHVQAMAGVEVPEEMAMIDLEPCVDTGEWRAWEKSVPQLELESHRCVSTDVVVTTVDTVRHVEVLRSWLASRRHFILCGPPGSGKTLTLTSTLQSMSEFELVTLNFSSGTTPELILTTFRDHCNFKRTPDGVLLEPKVEGKRLVVFCDEVNLPATDKYGTQCVVQFLRQLSEQGGFWVTPDTTPVQSLHYSWATLRHIQFVFACNPPTDPGRIAMSSRFLRHTPLLLVDYPARESLMQIYGTFNRALLKLQPHLRSNVKPLTSAMVDLYMANQEHFTADQQPQYVYSPRELSRWIRALYEAIRPLDQFELEGLVRLWAHEGLRLFSDRLVTEVEKDWCDERVNLIAREHFSSVDLEQVLARPILYSNWLTKNYVSVDQTDLRQHIEARLRTFYEEEMNVKLVVFDAVLDHVLRIDRVLRQPVGHLLLAGESGTGKTVLSRFVAWMNGLSVFQVKVTRRYTVENFDEDLRGILKRAGCGGEKVAFIFDESNALSSAFLERMNALLASGEVPGLFEGDEYAALMSACREAAHRDNVILDGDDDNELLKRFTTEVQNNLHVVFTMNPADSDLRNRTATSPALFNRCVVDWFGSWSQLALVQVAHEFTEFVDIPDDSCDLERASGPLLELAKDVADVDETSPPTTHNAVVAGIVQLHNDALLMTQHLSSLDIQTYLSPRDFLDFISHYTIVLAEKRHQLEEQQLHLNIGLDKLRATEEQVATLQASLGAKDAELKEKDAQANSKLQEMVQKQNEAEVKKEEAEKLSAELAKQDAVIDEQRAKAEADLAQAEPALREAETSVRSIKKSQMDEVRVLARPPKMVQMTMEAVAVMLGDQCKDWTAIRRVIRKDDFIEKVINFESDKLTTQQRNVIQEKYLSVEDFNFEKVNRSSKACGPLFKWVVSQVSYCEILTRVEPLRAEVAKLQAESASLRTQVTETNETIAELESSIAVYKAEYAELINETQTIKAEKERVQMKVERSTSLLANLTQERGRWEASSSAFQVQMTTLPGDALLAASFLAYFGFFAHHHRVELATDYRAQLEALGLKFKSDLSLVEYLSTPSDRLKWRGHGLPSDDLCVENAIVLQRFQRYPLVIDPSGHAIKFLERMYAEQKMSSVSFLDANFLKLLGSALRFGTPLLVQDVNAIDPILNPLLNKEFQRTGGRVLIRVGDEDIDFSPSFIMFMTTRDPSCRFSPDLCSRVTFVNFTVTPSSLQAQCLDKVLGHERPDISEKRLKLSKLQGEFQAQLRDLEEKLLAELAAVQGNILDDDSVIVALETLQKEAAEVAEEAAKTDSVMAEVIAASSLYEPLAEAASALYFAMKELPRLHFLYHLSLSFLMGLLQHVLEQKEEAAGGAATDAAAQTRVARLRLGLFQIVASRVSRGLLQQDKLVFALRLAQIYLGDGSTAVPVRQFDVLVRGLEACVPSAEHAQHSNIAATFGELTPLQQGQLELLCDEFEGLGTHLSTHGDEWRAWLQSETPESQVPQGWAPAAEASASGAATGSGASPDAAFRALMLLRALRPDRLLSAADAFVGAVFGTDFDWRGEFKLEQVVQHDAQAVCPLLLCSQPGHDPSRKVDAIANAAGVKYRSVAMGSDEGFDAADKALTAAMGDGSWVLLRNVHLCLSWLVELEKRLHTRTPHVNFRLVLTTELHPGLPVSLLRASDTIVFEPPSGIKASLLRSLNSMPDEKLSRAPAERGRLYLMLAWLHATVQERLRYAPVGWTKTYEYNDADQRCALSAIDSWVDLVSQGSAHVAPDAIPWQAVRTLLGASLYGGRVDNAFDHALLQNLVDQLFVAESFDANFALATSPGVGGESKVSLVTMPEGNTKAEFVRWVQELPEANPPSWLGLAPNAERIMLRNGGQRLVRQLATMQQQQGVGDASVKQASGKGQAAVQGMHAQVRDWVEALPSAFGQLQQDLNGMRNPLFRWLAREVKLGSELLELVRTQLGAVLAVCAGTAKPTNTERDLMRHFSLGTVPAEWRRYAVADITVSAWLTDLGKRVLQLQALQALDVPALGQHGVWLGGLFSPEAFVTATRQAVAQARGCGLDSLRMEVTIGDDDGGADADSTFRITDLTLEGAAWDGALVISDALRTSLAVSTFCWVQRNADAAQGRKQARVPVYLNDSRQTLLFDIDLVAQPSVEQSVWQQRGVAVIAWST